ncbi:MAG: cell division protein FtsZ [Chloroflexi bacterium]|nr:cell division protein FtsZ [Chloroflexota bacterium]
MKLLVVGFGQCGGRVADEFARLNARARHERGIEIVTGTFAVNTDSADLSGLRYISKDYQHRVLMGGRRTGGHGVGKINELGAEIAKENSDKVVDAIRTTKRFYESDAFLMIAGAAGGTGSGSLPVMIKQIKERYVDKPVYAIIVLPFEHEEATEDRTIYNTATCLRSVYSVADAVFVVDNQRFVKKDASLRNNLARINSLIVEPFYDVLCAGEEKKAKYVGARLLDAGDIMQSLAGWTVIGYGTSHLKLFKIQLRTPDFRQKSTEIHRGIHAMDEAISELSLSCNTADACRGLYLVSAPAKEINMDLVKELGDYLRSLAPKAIIRNGDYPREKGVLDVTVILSELSDLERVRNIYYRSTAYMEDAKRRQAEAEEKLKTVDDASKDVPSLL